MKQLFNDIMCMVFGCTNCSQPETCTFLKFAIISMIFGFLCITADYFVFRVSGTSYLKIKYVKNVFFIFLFWTLGSLVVGYLGAAAALFDTTKLFSALFVGVSWQFIFARWVAGKFEKEDSQPLNAN